MVLQHGLFGIVSILFCVLISLCARNRKFPTGTNYGKIISRRSISSLSNSEAEVITRLMSLLHRKSKLRQNPCQMTAENDGDGTR